MTKRTNDSRLTKSQESFPIVGIGASAGGLEAFTNLLQHLPLDTGMGFVLVQHLDPVHESALTKLLSRATSMPVREVTNNTRVETDHVYVIPPNTSMSIAEGLLKLLPRKNTDGQHRSIDYFLQSLAEDQHERSIAVILSGTASDGSVGCEAIKAEGGITFAQDESAKYDSMPRSAIAAGCIDFVLSPENIANELARIAQHPYVVNGGQDAQPLRPEREREADHDGGPEAPLASGGHGAPRTGAKRAKAEAKEAGRGGSEDDGFKTILLLLRNHCGVDFSLYKSSTIQRRVTRRLVLNKHNTLEEYAAFLKGNAKELDALYSDVLISVTSFFRNPEAFEALKRKVFPKLVKKRGRDEPVRVWVLGCSTGQEAYSIAIAFAEFSENLERAPKLQVFATDLNDTLLEKARHGLYGKTLAEDLSPERLRRFFIKEDGGYRVSKSLREQVVFARQNVISDPPFSRMDLISCRNLLIYLEVGSQKKIMPAFHYALKPGGFLFLGASESTGGFTELFEPADKKQRIFAKKAAPTPVFRLPLPQERAAQPSTAPRVLSPVDKAQGLPEGLRGEFDAQREADRVSVSRFAPPGVLINAELQVLQFRGATGAYLEPPSGKATFDVLKMARPGLMLPLRAALNKAKRENKPVSRENVRVKQNGDTREVNLQVIPLRNVKQRCYLVLFEPSTTNLSLSDSQSADAVVATKRKKKTGSTNLSLSDSRRVPELERELSETRDYLQSVQEQYEAANEELQASSEEVQSANEELQSINEELETSKEELESTNEELTTVNEEMVNRNAELNLLNSDLNNLQVSINTAIVLLSRDLVIRRFTPPAGKLFNLLASDAGRPLSGIRHNLVAPQTEIGISIPIDAGKTQRARTRGEAPLPAYPIEDLIREVIDTVSVRDREIQDRNGRWWGLRARPYMTLDNKIDGAVLVLTDIDALKRSEQEIKAARNYAEATLRTAPYPFIVLRSDLRVDTANDAFYKTFKVAPAETEGRLIYEVGNGQWDIPKLRELLEEILPRNSFFNDFEVTHEFPGIGKRTMLLNARRLRFEGEAKREQGELILLSVEDVTERMRLDESIRRSEDRFRSLVLASAQVVWTTNPDGEVEEDSPSWRAFTGQAYEQWKGGGWLNAIHPDDRMPTKKIWSECVADKSMCETEYRVRTADGSYRWTAVRAVPVLNPDGSIREWIGTNTDIHERKQAEEALRESEERYRTLFGNVPVAVFVCNRDAVIQHYNRRAVELWGREPECGVEQHCGSVKLWLPDGALLPHAQSPLVEVLRTGVPALNVEVFIERPDGSRLPVIVNFAALKNAQGEITGAVTSFMDITALKRAKEKLRENEVTFSTLVARSPFGTYIVDSQFRIAHMNASSQTGAFRNVRPAIGRDFAEAMRILWPEDVAQQVIGAFRHTLESGESYRSKDFRNPRADVEQTEAYEWELHRMTLPDGQRGVICYYFDSTQLRDVEAALRLTEQGEREARGTAEMANKVKDEFLAIVSHELRTPLNAIVGWTQMLKRGQLDPATAEKAIETIDRNAKAQATIIGELLDISRIISGKLKLDTQPIDFAGVIYAAREVVRPAADAKAIGIVAVLEPEAGLVAGDSVRLQQVVWNLLSNAVKFTPKQGRIEVQLKRAGTDMAMVVRDTGVGISPDFLPHVFDRFQQADSSEKRTHGGLGLGLSIVRNLVEMHGGSVRAESEGAGCGATFTVTLPVIAVSGAANLRAFRGASSASADSGTEFPDKDAEPTDLDLNLLSGLKVLAVDDQPDTRDLIILALTRYGAEVRACTSATEALKMMREWKPEIIVSDIGLPDEDGYDLMRKIRALEPEGGGRIPAIALTGYAGAVDESKARAAGYQVHMAKPVELRDLAATIAKLSGR